ncbi:hypothetical protein BCEP4_2660002 [Burkholderia cepacia]|nr:hypothetical protein BCEP4_2660002 [Burkholderia cepacia]
MPLSGVGRLHGMDVQPLTLKSTPNRKTVSAGRVIGTHAAGLSLFIINIDTVGIIAWS